MTRQGAKKFNQALSFDTSSVTGMSYMFSVRSACTLAPCSIPPASSPLTTQAPHLSHRFVYALSTRQGTNKFNMPLSFSTSSVTNMGFMFLVRSACALLPAFSHALPVRAVCAAAARTPSRLPARISPHIVQKAKRFNKMLSFDTSSVTDMSGMFQVRSARPLAHSLQSGPPRVRRAYAAARPPALIVRPAPRPTTYALLATRQKASAFNQPLLSIEMSSVTDVSLMFEVRSPAPVPWAPNLQPGPPRAHR